MEAWHFTKEEEKTTIWQIEKYCITIQIVLEAYLNSSDKYHVFPSALHGSLYTLSIIAGWEGTKLNKLPESEVYNSLSFDKLSVIQDGLQKIFELIQKNENKLPEYHFSETDYEYNNDPSIYGVVAFAIFNYYNNLSRTRSHDEAIRSLAVDLWLTIYPLHKKSESKSNTEIQNRLNIHLAKGIEQNLTLLGFPVITRLLINLNDDFNEKKGAKIVSERGSDIFKNILFRLLQQHFEKAFKRNPVKTLNMIPMNIKYDEENGQLIQSNRRYEKWIILNLRHPTR